MLRAWLEGPRAALLVFMAALGVRFAYLAGHPAAPIAGDAGEYHGYAVSLLETGRYQLSETERATRAPGYPAFLATVYSASGRSTAAVRVVQCLIGALACVLCLRLAALLVPGPWPLLCGLAAAFYFGMYSTPALLLSECLYGSLLVWAVLELQLLGSAWRALRCGMAFCAAAMVRPEGAAVALAAMAAAPAVLRPGPDRRRLLLAALTLGLGLSFWAGRNWAVLGRPLAGSSRSGWTLYLALQLPLEARGSALEPMYQPPAGLGELERDDAYREQFRRLRSRLGLSGTARAYAFDLVSQLYPFLPKYDAGFVLLAPLWVFALLLAWRRPELRPMAAAVLVSIALYTFFGGPVSRYRQTYAPLAVVLAAAGARELWERFPGRARQAAVGWASFNLLVWAGALHVRRLALAVGDLFFR